MPRAGSARARRSRRRRAARRAPSGAPGRRSGSGAGAGRRGGRRPAAGRSSRGRWRGRSAGRRAGAPPRTTRRRCRPRTAARSRPASAAPVSTSSRTRRGDVPRLAAAPVLAGVGVARLVGDEQLDRVAEDRVGEVARGRERLELVAELLAEEEVDGGEHLRPRAVVPRQREPAAGALAPLAEHGHVRVPEPVDRLELVADEEQLALAGPSASRSTARTAGGSCPGTRPPSATRKRSCSRSRISGWSASRSRAASWRSSKSSADSRSFAPEYAASKRSSSSCRSSRSPAAIVSSAACSTRFRASS